MTTVGYGDKVPKSVAGRLLSIIWIMVGIIIYGILTGSLTSAIMAANSPPPPTMRFEKVGVLQLRNYDAYMVAKSGGTTVQSGGDSFQSEIVLLIQKLRKKEIKGLLLDKYTLWFAGKMLAKMFDDKGFEDIRGDIEYFLTKTIRSEKVYKGPKLSYGILVKEKEVYDYFVEAFNDNHFHVERMIAEWSNENKLNHSTFKGHRAENFYSRTSTAHMFSPSEPIFMIFLLIVGCTIAFMCFFGIAYERRRKGKKTVEENDVKT